MKTGQKTAIILIIAIFAIVSGIAYAQSNQETIEGAGNQAYQQEFKRMGERSHRSMRGSQNALKQLARYQHRNLAKQLLSDLTGESADALKTEIRTKGMREVFKLYNIDRVAFHQALQQKETEIIKQATAAGTITKEQEEKIVAKMTARSTRREMMSKLIDNGLQQGVVTQEEVQQLWPRRR